MAQGSLTDLFRSLVDRLIVPRLDPLAFYDAEVKAMNDDGTVDIKPDSSRWGPGLSRVPIRHGLPGVTVRVKKGARVRLSFAGGDERSPYVALWDPGSLDTLTIEAETKILLKTPSAVVAQVEGNAKRVARMGDLVKVTGVCGPPGAPLEMVGYILDGAQKLTSE